MRRMNAILAGSLSVLLAGATSWAQEAKKVEPPSLPLVAKMPDSVEWTVTPQYSEAAPGAAPMPVSRYQITQVRTTKTGKLKRDQVTMGDGSVVEQWYSDTMYFWTSPDGDVVIDDIGQILPTEVDDPSPNVANGFPGVRWLKLENFTGVDVVDKRPSYHFAKENIEAWIDVETRLPVMYRSRNVTYRFKFSQTSPPPLAILPKYQEAIDAAQKLIDRRKLLEKSSR